MDALDVITGKRPWAVDADDCLRWLVALPAGCAHCCVTSPPYFGLRDYGTATWEGGDAACDHKGPPLVSSSGTSLLGSHDGRGGSKRPDATMPWKGACGKCGARRVDGQIGLEPTPGEYVARLVEVFAAVRRVLRPDGCLWLNLGDSYANGHYEGRKGGQGAAGDRRNRASANSQRRAGRPDGCKPKDLLGMPWRVAFALQADGWHLRSALPWVKRGAMPESVTDRPASALEYVFLLTPKPRYYFDMEAVRRPNANGTLERFADGQSRTPGGAKEGQRGPTDRAKGWANENPLEGRNLRNADFWFQSVAAPHGLCGVGDELVGLDVTSEPFPGAHFATFPAALVSPLIAAGTSERGCCPACGAPWRRKLGKVRRPTRPGENTKVKVPSGWDSKPGAHGNYHCEGREPVPLYRDTAEVGNRDPQRHCTETRTLGWEPGCACGRTDTVPCLVLDPFAGSGTVPMVARLMGRRAVGCELSPAYADMARRRVANPDGPRPAKASDSPLFDGLEA